MILQSPLDRSVVMAWIESHQELANHPKTKRLSRTLGISTAQAIGHLHLLWWWALDYAQDGDLSEFSWEDIAEAAQWTGELHAFAEALYIAGFTDSDDEAATFRIHDWDQYGARYLKRREQSRVRQQRYRDEGGRYTQSSNAAVTRDSRVSNTVTREDRRGEEKNVPPLVPPHGGNGADAPPTPKTKRATAMTDDWMPTEIDLAWAKGDGFPTSQVIGETEKFRDHFKASGKPMKDWDAAWKNWMRRSREFAPARASPNGNGPPVELSPERIAEHQRKARALGYQGEVRELT